MGKIKKNISFGKSEKFQLNIYSGWGFMIKYLTKGYNDYGYPLFIFQLIYGNFFLTLPWKHNIKSDPGHDAPSYGITYHNSSLMFYWNRKCKIWNLPYSYTWIRTSLLLKDKTWEHETKGNYKSFYEEPWLSKQWQFTMPYKHKTTNEGVIDLFITCHITEREWRQKWLKWTKRGAKIKRTLDVDFSEEVGPRRGSYKGGVLGTGFIIPKSGNYYDALKTMEKEYNMYSPVFERYKKIRKLLEKK